MLRVAAHLDVRQPLVGGVEDDGRRGAHRAAPAIHRVTHHDLLRLMLIVRRRRR